MKPQTMQITRLFTLATITLMMILQIVPQQTVRAASEILIEQVNVNSAQSTPTYSTNTLQSGVTYRIEVSGTYFNGSSFNADAECRSGDGWTTAQDSGPILDLLVVYGSAIGTPYLNSLQHVTAQDVNWGVCASNHVYSITVVGNGGTIGFVVSDEFWGDPAPAYPFCSSQFCDNQGTSDNSGSLTLKIFKQLYNFNGFFQPVDNQPTLNTVKAGRAIPIKFSLGGNQGLNIFAAGYPASTTVNCGAAAQDAVEDTLTAGSSTLSYDSSSDQYIYVWATERSWAGTCRTLIVKLNDGSTHAANFKFN